MANDAYIRIVITCGNCTHSWDLNPTAFIEKARKEGFRWVCPSCLTPTNVYHVKNLRPELWI